MVWRGAVLSEGERAFSVSPEGGEFAEGKRARLARVPTTRRQFLGRCAATAAELYLVPNLARASSAPGVRFPSEPRERIAVGTYPFREFIVGPEHKQENPAIELKDFAAHVVEKFNVNKIEPWTGHFPSSDGKYLDQFRASVEKANAAIANIAVDGEHSPYATDRSERQRAIAFGKQWVDAAVILGSPGIRTNIPPAKGAPPDVGRTADSLFRVAEHASAKNVVVNLENDNPISEDPFFLVKVIEKVNSPWLRALPDFGNTLAVKDPDYAYRGIDAMFGHAYSITHIKSSETNRLRVTVRVDMAKTFGIMKKHGYKGYCSMEWDDAGDPYRGTAGLIKTTLQQLS
jgi:sugar phosphate isomerase/epimerase